jgi:hypothetical protein
MYACVYFLMYYDRLDVPSWSYEGHCGWFGSKKSDLPDDIKDHLGRPRKVAPVTTTRHSRFDHLCKGTWLAECSIVHPEGGFILAVSTKLCCPRYCIVHYCFTRCCHATIVCAMRCRLLYRLVEYY